MNVNGALGSGRSKFLEKKIRETTAPAWKSHSIGQGGRFRRHKNFINKKINLDKENSKPVRLYHGLFFLFSEVKFVEL